MAISSLGASASSSSCAARRMPDASLSAPESSCELPARDRQDAELQRLARPYEPRGGQGVRRAARVLLVFETGQSGRLVET